jgi:hypothetical protein
MRKSRTTGREGQSERVGESLERDSIKEGRIIKRELRHLSLDRTLFCSFRV